MAKVNQKTVKLYDSGHKLASKLSSRFGISMAAVVELGLQELSGRDQLTLPAKDKRYSKSNSRKVLKKAVAA